MSSNYEPVKNWAKIPMGISFYGDCGGVAVDSKDNVYVFNRGTDPVCVLILKEISLRSLVMENLIDPTVSKLIKKIIFI